MTTAGTPRAWTTLASMLAALALLTGLGAGAIALERPTGELKGKVVDDHGMVLPGAKVHANGTVSRTLYAKADGSFDFHHLPVGDYYVSANTKGHDAQYQENAIKVEEGKITGEVDFKLARTNPSIEITNMQRVFSPSEPLRITARGNQLDDLAVSLYRLDLSKAAARDPELERLRTLTPAQLRKSGLLSPIRDWKLPVAAQNREDEDWFYQPVQVDDAKPGAYYVFVGGQPLPDRAGAARVFVEDGWWFTVGDLALVTKRQGNEVLAWTTNLQTKAPVPGAEIKVYASRSSTNVVAAKTDARGIARLTIPVNAGSILLLANKDGAPALVKSGSYTPDSPVQTYAFTDRPVYRPGQDVRFKGMVRVREHGKFKTAKPNVALVTIKDAVGADIYKQGYPLSDASSFDGTIKLSEDAPLGEYRAEISVGQAYEYVNFMVSDYRKPEFKVEITPAKPRWVLGETADVSLLAGYYFGAPVPGAKLNTTVYSAPMYGGYDAESSFYTGYADTPGIEPVWGFGDVVQQEELIADAQGRASLRVAMPRPPEAQAGEDASWRGDRVYTVEVEGMDASGRPVKAHKSFLATQSDLKLRLDADQALFAGGQAIEVAITTTDHDGKAQPGEVQVRVLKLESETKTTKDGDEYTETRRVPVFTGSVKTDKLGRGKVSIPSPGDGSYEIEGEVSDRAGRATHDYAWAWVAADNTGGSYRYGALQVLLDKKVYRPGDMAKALIVAPVPNASVLVTVEGERLHEARVVKLNGTSGLVEVPVTEAYKPNAFISAVLINGKEFMEAERSLNVLPEDKFLKVAITTPKARIEPGETITYAVETRDWKGQPVDAEVALAIVDEAIYAIEPDRTPDIRSFFHGPRWNTVSTTYSFAEDYSGGLDKFAPDPRVRARFEDTAAWFPSLRTGSDGKATVSVAMPDNLTTWIASVHAATADTKVGSTSHRLLAAKDLLVRLETPRFVVSGDRVLVSAIAHNYTERDQAVDLQLETRGLDIGAGVATKRVTIKPGGAERVTWEAIVPEGGGEAMARVFARPVGAAASGDAMQLPLPRLPYAVDDALAIATTAASGKAGEVDFVLPAGTLPGATIATNLHLTPLPAIAGAITYLHQYEYGCVEQTMSRALPDAALEPRLRAAGVPTDELFPKQGERMQDGVRRLLSFQRGDGGWGWWANDESKADLTSYVLYGLAEIRSAGSHVPEVPVKRATDRLKRALPGVGKDAFTRSTARRGGGADERAFMLFALSRWDAAPAKERDRLFTDRAGLSPYGQAQLALTLQSAKDPRAARVVAELRSKVDETDLHASWASAAEPFAWQDSATEATAWSLRALLAVTPDDPLVTKVVRWLESKNASGHWQSTKDTAAAAIALADYLAIRKPTAPEGFAAKVFVDDREVARYAPTAAELLKVPAPIVATVGPGSHKLRIEVEGDESETVDATAGVAFKRSADGLGAASAYGLSVSRRYLALSAAAYAKAKGNGPGSLFSEGMAKGLAPLGSETKAGDRILVELKVKAEKPVKWMAIADPLPAGCEILEDQPDNWSYWWSHQEYRDEQATFFFDELSAGERTLYYVMRPTTPGRYRVLPTTAWAMYAPEVRARGVAQALVIKEQ